MAIYDAGYTQSSIDDFDIGGNYKKKDDTIIVVGKPNVTDNIESDNIQNIYVGGYDPITKQVVDYKLKGVYYVKNVNELNASGINDDDFDRQSIIRYDGKDIQTKDIVAKSSIPYPKPLKKRFINAGETDQVISTVLNIYTFFIFDVARKSILRPPNYYRQSTKDDVQKIIDGLIEKEVQKQHTTYLDDVDKYSQMWTDYAPVALKHCLLFGIGAIFKELMNNSEIVNEEIELNIPRGSPCVLKQIHPYYIERLYQHRKSFKPLFLEYTDTNYVLEDDEIFNSADDTATLLKDQYEGWKSLVMRDNDDQTSRRNILLPLNQCVIFKNGSSLAPNIEYFGQSKVFSVLPISELNREIHYNIMPTANKLAAGGSGILFGDTRDENKLKTISGQMEQGANVIVTNMKNMSYQQINIQVDMAAIDTQRFSNVRHLLMGLNFPSPFINFENVTNRDTVRIIAEFFKNTSLEPLRTRVSRTMSDQWYLPLTMFFFNNIMAHDTSTTPTKYNFIDLKLEFWTEFENIDFAVLEDKLAALNPITFINDDEKREMARLDPLPINDQRSESMDKMNQVLNEIGKTNNPAEIIELNKQQADNINQFNKANVKQKETNQRNVDQNTNQ